MIFINTHEYTFSVNEFEEPTVLEGADAIGTLLTRLLLLVPGTIQSHPEMGVGLVPKYRFTIESDIDKLRDDFTNQIAKYLPQYQGVQVSAMVKNKVLYMAARIDNIVYNFIYDSENNGLQTTFRALADL